MYKVENVTIFGYANSAEDDPLYKEVFEVTKLLAESGFTIVQGGGSGLMRAAGQGARAGGGRTIGVILSPDEGEGTTLSNFEGRDKKNVLDEEIETKTYVERTLTLMDLGDLYVVFNGGTGTISEFGMAWGLAKLHFGHHKPLILYGNWWHNIMESFAKNMFIREPALKVYTIVDTPSEVLGAIKNLCQDSEYYTC